MSATYIKSESVSLLQKLEIFMRGVDMETLNSNPILIWTADNSNVFFPVAAFITGTIGGTPGTVLMNRLILGDNVTLTYAIIDVQQVSGSSISTGTGYIFDCGVSSNGASGGDNDATRNTFLYANADDLTATGDYTLTILYYLIPIV
jgi:hypothetical protein